jgi:hypothetical protein
VLPEGDAPTCTCALCAACIRPGVTGCTAATALRRVQSSTGIAGAGPTTSPSKPTASMHMSAASYCRAGALTRFICARHARTARAAALAAHGRSGGQGGAPLWPLSAPVGLVVVHARSHHHARAHGTGLGRPPTRIGCDRAISKSAGRPCMSTASWATCTARPTALTATRRTPRQCRGLWTGRVAGAPCTERETQRLRETQRERETERETHTHTYADAHAYTHTHIHTCVRAHTHTFCGWSTHACTRRPLERLRMTETHRQYQWHSLPP